MKERREEERYLATGRVTLRSENTTVQCDVFNISRTGMHIVTHLQLIEDQVFNILYEDSAMANQGYVAWKRGLSNKAIGYGIQFVEPLDQTDIDGILKGLQFETQLKDDQS